MIIQLIKFIKIPNILLTSKHIQFPSNEIITLLLGYHFVKGWILFHGCGSTYMYWGNIAIKISWISLRGSFRVGLGGWGSISIEVILVFDSNLWTSLDHSAHLHHSLLSCSWYTYNVYTVQFQLTKHSAENVPVWLTACFYANILIT